MIDVLVPSADKPNNGVTQLALVHEIQFVVRVKALVYGRDA
jgi:hypothetical protein